MNKEFREIEMAGMQMGLGMGMGMDWLVLALLAGGGGWAGYALGAGYAKAAAAKAKVAAFTRYNELMAMDTLDDKQEAERAALVKKYPHLTADGYMPSVGGPSFGTGGMGPRPDFAMGYQPWQAGTTVAAITGGSLGY